VELALGACEAMAPESLVSVKSQDTRCVERDDLMISSSEFEGVWEDCALLAI